MKYLTTMFAAGIAAFAAPVFAADLPEPVARAVSEAAPYAAFRTSFSLRASAPGKPALVMRYDAPADEWAVVEGDMDKLEGSVRQAVEGMQEELTEPGELTYHDIEEGLGDISFETEETTHLVYRFKPLDDGEEMPEAFAKAVEPRLYLSKQDGTITRVSVRSAEPFKPAAVAKIDTLIIEQDFEPIPGGPAVLTRYYNKIAGSAMFKDFSEEFTLEFFDFVPVE